MYDFLLNKGILVDELTSALGAFTKEHIRFGGLEGRRRGGGCGFVGWAGGTYERGPGRRDQGNV